jgi:hypothetical protein
MTDKQEQDDFDAAIENEPVFVCSQLRVGETLTQRDVDAIQAVLKELDDLENKAVDDFGNGREFGIREVGGDELFAAVTAKDDDRITKIVREAIAKMEARTAEIKAATLPEPTDSAS